METTPTVECPTCGGAGRIGVGQCQEITIFRKRCRKKALSPNDPYYRAVARRRGSLDGLLDRCGLHAGVIIREERLRDAQAVREAV